MSKQNSGGSESLGDAMQRLAEVGKSLPLPMLRMPAVRVKLLYNFPFNLVKPSEILSPAREGDAGADLHATESVTLFPGEKCLMPTGLVVAIPDGYEMQIRPRSGMALKQGVTVLNSPGTIDSGYRGEVGVILFNTNKIRKITISRGDRVAQAVFARFERPSIEIVPELDETERGARGFGSSG